MSLLDLSDYMGLYQEPRLNQAYMSGVERGQRNVGVVNLYRIARALDMSLLSCSTRWTVQRGGTDGST